MQRFLHYLEETIVEVLSRYNHADEKSSIAIIKMSRLLKEPPVKVLFSRIQKQPSIGVLVKRYSENIQQIYRRTPMPKFDFNKVVLQLYQ